MFLKMSQISQEITCIGVSFEPIKCQCCPHVETSQLICKANQLTGFYIRATLAFNRLMRLKEIGSGFVRKDKC